MKRELSPLWLASFLILGCVIFRLAGNLFPEAAPNISPMLAVTLVGAMVLPVRWGWLVGVIALLITDVAFLQLNLLTGGTGSMFSWGTLIAVAFYAGMGGLGAFLANHKSLPKVIGASVAGSIIFYVALNTFAWLSVPGYEPTFGGWVQANTMGLPGFPPSWLFLRNAIAGDLFFVVVLLFVLDRNIFHVRGRVGSLARA